MSDDISYLTEGLDQSDKSILKNLSKMGATLKQLKLEMETKAAEAEQAKKKYEHFANVLLPTELVAAGVNSIALEDGGTIQLKHNFYCQPNKNAEDRALIAKWLREHDGGYIIEHNATCTVEDAEKAGIPFTENASVNTAKLKSFLKDGIGATSGVQRFTVEDIPACIHFQEVTTVEIKV